MVKCPNCHQLNDETAHFCSRCGYDFILDLPYERKITEENKKDRGKNKTKNKKVTKTKKEKAKDRNRRKDKRDKNDVVVVKQMSLLQKFMFFLLFLLFVVAAGAAGIFAYHIYTAEVREVPNVVGMTLEDAKTTLEDAGFRVTEKTEVVEDESEIGIVLDQSIKAGETVSNYKKIKLTVGIEDHTLTLPDFVGLSMESACTFLDEQGITYKIKYQESDTSDGMVLDQSIKANKKIDRDQTITLTVSKKKEETNQDQNPTDTNESTDEESDNETSTPEDSTITTEKDS